MNVISNFPKTFFIILVDICYTYHKCQTRKTFFSPVNTLNQNSLITFIVKHKFEQKFIHYGVKLNMGTITQLSCLLLILANSAITLVIANA